MSPKELEYIINAYKKKTENELIRVDAMNHILGRYIAIAVNNPKSYPREPLLSRKTPDTVKMTGNQMKDFAKRFTAKFNKKVNG